MKIFSKKSWQKEKTLTFSNKKGKKFNAGREIKITTFWEITERGLVGSDHGEKSPYKEEERMWEWRSFSDWNAYLSMAI